MTFRASIPLILTLIAGTAAAALPAVPEPSRELLVRHLERLTRSPSFHQFKSTAVEIVEVAHFEAGLFVRYRHENKECLGRLEVGADARDVFVPDGRCPYPRMTVQQAGAAPAERMGDVLAMISAVRFLNRMGIVSPPSDRSLAVRRENNRVVVTYLSDKKSAPCSIALVPPSYGRLDANFWFLATEPACEVR